MKTIIFNFIIMLFSMAYANAQTVNIKGRIIEDSTSVAIVGALVILVDNNLKTTSSSISDSNGFFHIKGIESGNFSLSISHASYNSLSIELFNLVGNNDLGNIHLSPKVIELDEVAVVGKVKSVRIEGDRMAFIPSKEMKSQSYNSFDLLYKLSMPEIRYDMSSESLSSLKNGSMQIRLNGVLITQEDLKSINPKDIRIIDYIDQPGIRWGDNVAAVINIKTNRIDKGVQTGVNTNNEATNPNGKNSVYTRIYRGKNMFYVSAGINYKTTKEQYGNSFKRYSLPSQTIILNKEGVPMNNRYLGTSTKFEFNRKFNDKLTFNTRIAYNYRQSPDNINASDVVQDNALLCRESTLSSDYSHNTAVDLYLDYVMSSKDRLIVDLTGTYIKSEYNRTYTIGDSPFSAYSVDGNKKSFISEFIYERKCFKNHTFTAGLRSNIANTNNVYNESGEDDNALLSNRDIYLYVALGGNIKKLSYSVGVGYSYEYIGENETKNEYSFFRPRVNLSYSLGKGWSLRYALMINPVSPKLSELTDFKQIVNEFEVYDGNPNLRPYQAYINQLSLGYYSNRTTIVATGYYQYNKNPIFYNPVMYSSEDNQFIHTIANQKGYNHIQAKIYVSHKLFNDGLSLSGYGVFNRYINQGILYTTTLSDFIYGATVSYDRDKWGVSTNLYSPIDMLFGQTLIKNPMSLDIGGYYKHKGFKVGLGVSNPFMSTKSEIILNSKLLNSSTANYNRNCNNRIYITFAWNFSSGISRQIFRITNNMDNSSGIVK